VEAETPIESREAMDPVVISLEETSEEENDSVAWGVPL
jgi:hypothetical protein